MADKRRLEARTSGMATSRQHFRHGDDFGIADRQPYYRHKTGTSGPQGVLAPGQNPTPQIQKRQAPRINQGKAMSDDHRIGHAQRLAAIAADIPLGAHLKTYRRGYVHHGIYAGNGEVVHYAGFKGFLRCGPVERTTLADFADGCGFRLARAAQARYSASEIVRRAKARLGEDDYRLLTNNCEHFCTWCLTGESRSEQVESLLSHPWRAFLAMVERTEGFSH